MSELVINIESSTLNNKLYRRVIYTTPQMQLVLMSLLPGEDIPMEIHPTSQFMRVEGGTALVQIGNMVYNLRKDDIAIIPANTYHYVKNLGNEELSLYLIYSPPEHLDGEITIRQPAPLALF